MEKLVSSNKLLNTRRGFLKTAGVSVLGLMGTGSLKAFSQGVDFLKSANVSDDVYFQRFVNS